MPSSAISPGARLLARSMLRANLRATLVLTVFAGLAGGIVLTAAEVARRTASAYDRYLDFADVADVALVGCPRGVTEADTEEVGFAEAGCGSARSAVEIRADVVAAGSLESAVAGGLGIVGVDDPLSPSGWRTLLAFVQIDAAPGLLIANPIVVEGRLPTEGRPDEIVLNEAMADSGPYEVGDTITMRPFTVEQLFDVGLAGAVPAGPQSEQRVVGIVRMPDDLQPARPTAGIPGAQSREGYIYTTPAWWAANGPDVATYFLGVAGRLLDGDDIDSFSDRLDVTLPDRIGFTETVITDARPVITVIDLQANAVWLVGAVAALAALIFVGQALARQIARETSMRDTLRALGFVRRDVVTAAVVRVVPVALAAAVLAVGTAVALSPVGPVGVARDAEVDPGVHVDMTVLLLGFLGVVVVVIALTTLAATSSSRSRPGRRVTRSVESAVPWPLSVRIGLLLGRTRGTIAAIACAAVAVASVAGVAGYLASLRALEDDPRRFGVTWSLFLGEYSDTETWSEGLALARADPAVTAAGGLRADAGLVDDELELLMVAFEPASDPAIGPVVLEGRAPVGLSEVALGDAAMDALGVEVGDQVDSFGWSDQAVTVVGRIVANDNGIETINPSMAALVSPELFDVALPFGGETSAQHVLVSTDPDVPLVEAAIGLQDEFGRFVAPPIPPAEIRNMRLVAPALVVAAAVVAALAVAALVHSLASTVRIRRRDLATLRALGFTRSQVFGAVGWQATAVAIVAAVLGVPVGLLVSRLSWSAIESRLGVESPAEVPAVSVLVACLGAIALANLATTAAARRAVRLHAAEVLRAE